MVRIHAYTIRPATPHRTAENRCAAPTPTMAPVIVWVVETGMPQCEAARTAPAAPVSAQKPENGFNFVIRVPIVRTIRHPPVSVPRALAACAERMIQRGISFRSGRYIQRKGWDASATTVRFATSSPAMIPIVFWASLVPCDHENAAADRSWARRNQRSTEPYDTRWKIHDIPIMRIQPIAMPISGEITMNDRVFTQADPGTIAATPTRATAAPV